jgi:hypothetical protein
MILKKIKFKKNLKKDRSQNVLIFKTHDPCYEPETNTIYRRQTVKRTK